MLDTRYWVLNTPDWSLRIINSRILGINRRLAPLTCGKRRAYPISDRIEFIYYGAGRHRVLTTV
jgi:hypothetical protein